MSLPLIVYGSYGYTGQLIVEECKAKGVDVILSGRNAEALKKQSSLTGFPFEAVDIENNSALCKLLEKGSTVIHAAGPYPFATCFCFG
jgi:short subunit dehydrogenase-like uncharacterized protein